MNSIKNIFKSLSSNIIGIYFIAFVLSKIIYLVASLFVGLVLGLVLTLGLFFFYCGDACNSSYLDGGPGFLFVLIPTIITSIVAAYIPYLLLARRLSKKRKIMLIPFLFLINVIPGTIPLID